MKPSRFKSLTTPWRVTVPARCTDNGKPKVHYFSAKTEADKFCVSFHKRGLPAAIGDTENAKAKLDLLARVTSPLGADPVKVLRAIDFYEKHCANVKSVTVREAAERFCLHQKKEGRSPITLADDTAKLGRLLQTFELVQAAEITDGDLRTWFLSFKPGTYRRSLYKSVHKFFAWMKTEKIIGFDPMDEIKPLDDWGKRKGILPVPMFGRMLRVCAGLEPINEGEEVTTEYAAFLPYLVLAGFCGMRNCELIDLHPGDEVIRWEDINWTRGFVHVREAVAKQTERDTNDRYINNPLSIAAMKEWLLPVAKPAGPIVPFGRRKYYELKGKLVKALKIKLPENGLRNSFASYFLTATDHEVSVGKLSLEMGNSEQIAKSYYIQALEPDTGRAWFSLKAHPGGLAIVGAAA